MHIRMYRNMAWATVMCHIKLVTDQRLGHCPLLCHKDICICSMHRLANVLQWDNCYRADLWSFKESLNIGNHCPKCSNDVMLFRSRCFI